MDDVQYYEFVALDRPLTLLQLHQVRASSASARITATSFVATDRRGDFCGDALSMVRRFYDAHLHLAPWGTRHLVLRVPASVLDEAAVAPYCAGEVARAWSSGDHTVLRVAVDPEIGGEDLIEDEMLDAWGDDPSGETGAGWLSAMLPAREQLLCGDHRVLYLAWLLAVQRGCVDDDDVEPPVPPGLADLPESLRALVGFFGLAQELLAVAALGDVEGHRRRTVGRLLGAEARLRSERDSARSVPRGARGSRVQQWTTRRGGPARSRGSAGSLRASG